MAEEVAITLRIEGCQSGIQDLKLWVSGKGCFGKALETRLER